MDNRISDAGEYKLVQMTLVCDFMNDQKTQEFEKQIKALLDNVPEGYRILTQFKVKRKHHLKW